MRCERQSRARIFLLLLSFLIRLWKEWQFRQNIFLVINAKVADRNLLLLASLLQPMEASSVGLGHWSVQAGVVLCWLAVTPRRFRWGSCLVLCGNAWDLLHARLVFYH